MRLTYVRLLEQERELYRLPRDVNRFRAYLRMTVDFATKQVRLPLLIMNTMAREHLAEHLDRLLALDAERIAEEAMREAASHVADVPGSFRVALVVPDDLKGGGTNRFAYEYEQRRSAPPRPSQAGLDWICGHLWVSEPASPETVRMEVLTSLDRVAYIHRHGRSRTLRELMPQEGQVLARAGCMRPTLDPEDLAYTRWVLEPLLDATDMPTAIEALYGDAAARAGVHAQGAERSRGACPGTCTTPARSSRSCRSIPAKALPAPGDAHGRLRSRERRGAPASRHDGARADRHGSTDNRRHYRRPGATLPADRVLVVAAPGPGSGSV